jgi:hypothetical protein
MSHYARVVNPSIFGGIFSIFSKFTGRRGGSTGPCSEPLRGRFILQGRAVNR